MNENELMIQFLEDLHQEVISAADTEGEDGDFRVDQFTQKMAEYLIEAGEIDDIEVCFYKSKGMQINGYSISSDEDCIDLFVSIFNQNSSPVSVTKTQCETLFRQAQTVLKKGIAGFHTQLEEASEVYDAFQRISEVKNNLTRCRIFLLTDGVVKQDEFKSENVDGISVFYSVWDLTRTYRFASSGKKFEPIEIDFQSEFETLLPCLSLSDPESDYEGYLAVIPGEILAKVYQRYGPRLLERNVRSFLQARGKVNKGIRNTILEEPHRFFAYNNGITATADLIEFEAEDNSKIKKLRNLQIVNGGQTTASLYHTAVKDKADLGGIYVQAKISLIPEEHVNEIVPLISRYANSQNKVNDADFYANDPFHVQLEELSRIIWTPAIGATSRATRWFYERARGQYMDAKSRESTPARKKQFEATSPTRQKFTKTDLAKYENTWMQRPHIVSLGAQKNFNHFSVLLKERGSVKVDKRYFEHLIAKAILFKRADKIIKDQNYGGYKANIVTYTLAWISHHTSQRLDLDSIWNKQAISPSLQEVIREVSIIVHQKITNPPQNRNITEWCKRKECWEHIKDTKIDVLTRINTELLDISKPSINQPDRGINAPNDSDLEIIEKVKTVPAEEWFKIAKWAKETDNLQSWQRSLAFSIGKLCSQSKEPSYKQANHGLKILEEVRKLGFKESSV